MHVHFTDPPKPRRKKGVKSPDRPPKLSARDHILLAQIKQAGLPAPTPELRFHDRRRWRFDFAWPEEKVALEIEGGAFKKGECPRCRYKLPLGGRHQRGPGFVEDMTKYASAFMLGWTVLRVLPQWIDGGQALYMVQTALRRYRAWVACQPTFIDPGGTTPEGAAGSTRRRRA